MIGVLVLWILMGQEPAAAAGKKIEEQSCIQCHSLRLIHSQRLSSAAWQKEITKMIGWGATVDDEKALLHYLTQEYGDGKPVPNPTLSTTKK